MKRKYMSLMAAIVAAVFIISALPVSAALSNEKVGKDYRNMQIMNKQGVVINKPTAQFAAKRVVNGRTEDAVISYTGYDCSVEFPTLVCYVGDTLTFEDLSYDNNSSGGIVEWDWQYYGALGDSYKIYNYNIVDGTSYTLTTAGETIFYLNVKNNAKPKTGCCDPWSENGNHQVVGKNKWFPNGAYWYFTAIRVVVKPVREAMVYVRYWDAPNNRIFHEGYISAGQLLNDGDTVDTSFRITDWDGYKYSGWNVQLPDGAIQYAGTERDVAITLASWVPEKYLNIEYYPYITAGVEVRYWDMDTNKIIDTDFLSGGEIQENEQITIKAEIKDILGYVITGWRLTLPDGTEETTGNRDSVNVILTGENPRKIVEVECLKLDSYGGGEPVEDVPEPTVTIKPSGDCNGIIEWTETDSHRVFVGYTSSGRRKYKTCTHSFDYRATLTADADITPSTLKSGYGFEMDIKCSLDTKLVSRSGGCSTWGKNRSALISVKDPTKATVYIPWDMKNNLGVQNKTITMDSNGKLKFRLPVSNVSQAGARKIYTPVEIAGTSEEPVSHDFEVYISGGGIEGAEFCQKLIGTITINGDMYEDDFSGSD